jgi:hypothetical protein
MSDDQIFDEAPEANSYDWDKAGGFVKSIENIQNEIDAINAEAQLKCQPHREDMKQVKKDMKDDLGIPLKAFNAVVAARRAEAKAEGHREKLSTDHKDSYDQIRHALGDLADTPLGEAALADAAE